MAVKGQRFSLDPDADNFKFDVQDEDVPSEIPEPLDVVKEIREREPTAPPPPPTMKSRTGFPEHRSRKNISTFKQQKQANESSRTDSAPLHKQWEPSDRAIAQHMGKKYGFDAEAQEKAQINEENKQRIARMSVGELEETRAELLSNLSPALVQRLLKRANIEEDQQGQDWDAPVSTTTRPEDFKIERTQPSRDSKPDTQLDQDISADGTNLDRLNDQDPYLMPKTHFPVAPRDADSFVPLDPDSETFLADLKSHYFPETTHDPNTLSWLQDPTQEEIESSPYADSKYAYAPSDIRFDFNGRLVPPSVSETISVEKGLHHHGNAPSSAGYTIPELAMLCRSSLPNQRCIAYRTLGRILYRLGRGDFGSSGSELNQGLWSCIERERPIDVMMSEANRIGGHMSAKNYATDALWLWRKGGGGDRGVLKPSEQIVR